MGQGETAVGWVETRWDRIGQGGTAVGRGVDGMGWGGTRVGRGGMGWDGVGRDGGVVRNL